MAENKMKSKVKKSPTTKKTPVKKVAKKTKPQGIKGIKKSLNVTAFFTDYCKAVEENNIDNLIDINNKIVHQMTYKSILQWSKLLMHLAKGWKGKLDTKGKETVAIQLRFVLEKLKWYEPMLKTEPNALIELSTELDIRRNVWAMESQAFDKQMIEWEKGKLNCKAHKIDKVNVNTCVKCITNFDNLLEERLEKLHYMIQYIEVNKINMNWKHEVLTELVGAYNSLVDVHKTNYDFISKNSDN